MYHTIAGEGHTQFVREEARNEGVFTLRRPELRALAHIIDMHQLTKDPEMVLGEHPPTESSPARNLTPFQLNRYLDYCSEMLSLVSKIGALYVQSFPDAQALAAVADIGNLTTELSQKIWQKIMILDRYVAREQAGPSA